MDIKFFRGFHKRFPSNPYEVDRIIVSAFLEFNKLVVINNIFLQRYVIKAYDTDWEIFNSFKEYYITFQKTFSFEDLIQVFEFIVSPSDKRVNGAIYTPDNIKSYIINGVIDALPVSIKVAKVCDVACGCGGFLYSYAKLLNFKYGINYRHIFNDLLYGVDITQYSIDRSKITLSLLAIFEGEDVNFQFNLEVGNSLDFSWVQHFPSIEARGGFDAIIGNPPYVCAKNLSVETKALLERWPVALSGNPDLYIPFFQLGIEALQPKGVLGYITVNTFTKSVNGRKLREYFSKNKFNFTIIDFGGEQVFKGRTTYTCICFINKSFQSDIHYCLTESKSLKRIEKNNFVSVPYAQLDNKEGWVLSGGMVKGILHKLRTSGKPLSKIADIKGGIATLKNYIFIFKPIAETDTHYLLRTKNLDEYWIEKKICRNAIKANSLKAEQDISSFMDKLIFPYQRIESIDSLFSNENKTAARIVVMTENHLKTVYPDAYKYLEACKDELASRDKGSGDYVAWYAYGRSQGLSDQGPKLLFPHISDKAYFVYTEEDLLFYNGFSIVSSNKRLLLIMQKVLMSALFWFYVKHMSKPYSGNFYGLGKNFIKDFTIPEFTSVEEEFLLNCDQAEAVNSFLTKKYKLSHESIDYVLERSDAYIEKEDVLAPSSN